MNRTTEEFYKTAGDILKSDARTVLLYGVSGVGICVDLSKDYPGRVVDAGIMEQAIVGMASGMSIAGMIPIVYGQSTFFIERAYEQLKIDFGYQKVGGNFVLYGGSTEFGTLGATHCCPAALAVLSMIPGMEIVVPGRPEEFTTLFKESYDNGHPTVYRTSLFANDYCEPVHFGRANVVKKGNLATVVAIGPMLNLAMEAFNDEDVTILYYSTVVPFDEETLKEQLVNDRILLMEPSYQGGIMHIVSKAMRDKGIKYEFVGYPLEFITNHGLVVENMPMYGLTTDSVKLALNKLLL
jgi:transketolase